MIKKYERIFKYDCEQELQYIEAENTCCCLDTKDGLFFYEAVIKINVEMARFSEILDGIQNDLMNTKNIDDFINILNTAFEKDKIKFWFSRDESNVYTKTGGFDVKSLYVFVFIFKKLERLQRYKSSKDYDIFCEEVLSRLGHELIHRHEALKIEYEELRRKLFKGFKPVTQNDWRKYFANKHELMSYAWQIVNNYRMHGMTDNVIRKILGLTDSNSNTKFELGGQVFRDYYTVFKINEEPLKLLHKYMYMYLD